MCLNNFCFLCLKSYKNICSQDSNNSIWLKKLQYFLPEQAFEESKVPRNICDHCTESLNNTYEFKKMCSKNIIIFNECIKKLAHESGPHKDLSELLTEKSEIFKDICESMERANFEINDYKKEKGNLKEIDDELVIKENEVMLKSSEENLTENTIENINIEQILIKVEPNQEEQFQVEMCEPHGQTPEISTDPFSTKYMHSMSLVATEITEELKNDLQSVESSNDDGHLSIEDTNSASCTTGSYVESNQSQSEIEFMLSSKGKKLIIFENFKFRKTAKFKLGLRWRCTNKKCPANLITDEGATTILETSTNHNHGSSTTLAREIISNSVKRKAKDELYKKPAKLIQEILESTVALGQLNPTDIYNIRRCTYRARRRTMPSLPKHDEY